MLSAADVLIGLEIAVAIMFIIVLYHVLFIAVDLRKILRRIEEITAQLEDVFMKPISIAEHLMEYAMEFLEEKHDSLKKKPKKLKGKEHKAEKEPKK